MVYDPTTTITLKFIDLQHKLIVSYVKSLIEFVGINGLEQSITVESILTPRLVECRISCLVIDTA